MPLCIRQQCAASRCASFMRQLATHPKGRSARLLEPAHDMANDPDVGIGHQSCLRPRLDYDAMLSDLGALRRNCELRKMLPVVTGCSTADALERLQGLHERVRALRRDVLGLCSERRMLARLNDACKETMRRAAAVKTQLASAKDALDAAVCERDAIGMQIPNFAHPSVVLGAPNTVTDRFGAPGETRLQEPGSTTGTCIRDASNVMYNAPRPIDSVHAPLNQEKTHNAMGKALNNAQSEIETLSPSDHSGCTDDHMPRGSTAERMQAYNRACARITDWDGACRAAGTGFVALKGKGALLEMALVRHALAAALQAGWTPVLPPDIVHRDALAGTGFRPRAANMPGVYGVCDPGDARADLVLAGTSEVSLAAMLAGRTLPADEGPVRLVAVSHCFRAEDDGRSLYRVRQFTKVELFAACLPAQSDALFGEILALQKHILGALSPGAALAFRTVHMQQGGELGAAAAKKCDNEVFLPLSASWGEVSSASHCTDYQARRLAIRMAHRTHGSPQGLVYAHTLNGTALAVPRLVHAILENALMPDGAVSLPHALRAHMLDGSSVL